MNRLIQISLLAAAVVLGACASTTEPTAASRAASNRPAHSGYMLAWGKVCDPSADSTCAP